VYIIWNTLDLVLFQLHSHFELTLLSYGGILKA